MLKGSVQTLSNSCNADGDIRPNHIAVEFVNEENKIEHKQKGLCCYELTGKA